MQVAEKYPGFFVTFLNCIKLWIQNHRKLFSKYVFPNNSLILNTVA